MGLRATQCILNGINRIIMDKLAPRPLMFATDVQQTDGRTLKLSKFSEGMTQYPATFCVAGYNKISVQWLCEWLKVYPPYRCNNHCWILNKNWNIRCIIPLEAQWFTIIRVSPTWKRVWNDHVHIRFTYLKLLSTYNSTWDKDYTPASQLYLQWHIGIRW